ncbi:hypothetical protein Plim_3069 [Planctopirus limnophila DSM 3776]|uniref:Uncharacterized protein n=1 Tax=Planctopirus limnophila (strain ATCC 43296 / DSM 3776 / IFAM 1008 / Mu 290) TaxID=521674 RepID=D5SST7_PLAL2|nr:hypothetical protein Plim_3069 [Planctopirus limnophila DSM 3776]
MCQRHRRFWLACDRFACARPKPIDSTRTQFKPTPNFLLTHFRPHPFNPGRHPWRPVSFPLPFPFLSSQFPPHPPRTKPIPNPFSPNPSPTPFPKASPMTTRTVETPNPATPSASFPLVPLLKPASGNLTLTATVYRDSGDDTPTLVTVKNQTGATLGSTTLTTPPGNLTANISIPATAIQTCQVKPTIECTPEPPVLTSCCEQPIPRTLTVTTEITGDTSNVGGTYKIKYRPESTFYAPAEWWSEPSAGGDCQDVVLLCSPSWASDELRLVVQGTCDRGTYFDNEVTVVSCSPLLIEFTFTATGIYSPEENMVVTGTITE